MRISLILCSLFFSQAISADETFWTVFDAHHHFKTSHTNENHIHDVRKVHLDIASLKQALTATSTGGRGEQSISLPNANGTFHNFTLHSTSVMSSELASRYPEIKTWKIVSTENASITGRIDIGPRGFHGLFHTTDGERIFIDPEHSNGLIQTEIYNVLSSRAIHGSAEHNFTCELHGDISAKQILGKELVNPSDDLRTYRLALAVTGEYTQLFGGTKAYALAGVTSTLNRLNHVFERDLNISLQLVEDNDKLIFTSPVDDPYSNQNVTNMAEENILTINKLIGIENYDIGHVFGTGKTGGLAFIGSACGKYKAGGVTGSNSPEGDAFNIDYVAHEIGHQLGASHTFNGYDKSCTTSSRAQNSAVEPGSGSSIMGYAGLCGSQDLQVHSDPFFHSHSIAQIKRFTQQAEGASCGKLTASLNNKPVVNAGENYSIPAQTPFALTGGSNDIDGDPLFYSWEQTDTGTSSDLHSDLIDNPLFRVWNPTNNPTRYFPRLNELLHSTSGSGEFLPMTDRELNFTLLVRDNNGGLASDAVRLDVINTGSAFAITNLEIPSTLTAGTSFDLQWNVADTDKAPINCKAVNIGFINSYEDYPPLLLNSENDGRETINIPVDIDTVINANLKISCVNNIFFAVSQTKHSVLPFEVALNPEPTNIPSKGSGSFSFLVNLGLLLLLLAHKKKIV